jgi:hypothetical protein
MIQQHDYHGYDAKLLAHRNNHGGIEVDELRGRQKVLRVRSSPDARLFKHMTSEQEAAFYAIARAYEFVTAGMGCKAMDYGAVRGGSSMPQEIVVEMVNRYNHWRAKCKQFYVSGLMALDVIADGMSLAASEDSRKMQRGAAIANLLKALDLW